MSLAAAVVLVQKILVVEGEDASRNLLSLLLSAEGYEIRQARDGEEALALLQTIEFDLVLADIVLPRLDGLRLITKVRTLAPYTAVMIMTGYVLADSQSPGADQFITKPFTFEDLRYKIREVLRKKWHPRPGNH
jgi:DNA-binding response OmpR family regulator